MANKDGKRDRAYGSGGLRKRAGSPFWYAIWRVDGKQYSESTHETGKLKAQEFLKNKLDEAKAGITPANSSDLHYSDLRALLLKNYAENEMSSLRESSEGVEYIDCLKHLDPFFGWEKQDDSGCKVDHITTARIDTFKAERKAAGAAPATINRSLAALRRMFHLAQRKLRLANVPFIEMLPEPSQPRQGFLSVADYEKLYAEFGREVKNKATGQASTPFAYIQPILQTAFYTGMRLGELLNLQWSNVDLAENMIVLRPDQCKNESGREIPMIDGLPATFESLRRADPEADENDLVFRGPHGRDRVGSFIKAWRKACVKCAIRTKLNGVETVSHFEPDGTYRGLVFHDLRRTFVSNMVHAGVPQLEAMAISGHKTPSVFKRYNIESRESKRSAAERVSKFLAEKRKAPPAHPRKLRAVKTA